MEKQILLGSFLIHQGTGVSTPQGRPRSQEQRTESHAPPQPLLLGEESASDPGKPLNLWLLDFLTQGVKMRN